MDVALLGARLLLAAVFLVAGIAKVADRAGTRRMLADFGLPGAAAGMGATALPLAEVAVGAGLLLDGAAPWAALAAAILLAAFCAAIARSLLRGEQPECNCFGRVHSRPVGRGTLARNAGLLALAAFIAGAGWSDPGASTTAWLASLSGGEAAVVAVLAALALLAALQASFSFQLLKQNGRLLRRIEALERPGAAAGPHVGDPAPPFWLPDLQGRVVGLEELVAGGPVLVVFADGRCESCDAVLAAAAGARADADGRRVVLVADGPAEEIAARVAPGDRGRVLVGREQHAVAVAFGATRLPAAVAVDGEGRIAGPRAEGPEAVLALIAPSPPALEVRLVAEGAAR